MTPQSETPQTIEQYIDAHHKAGVSDQHIAIQLMQAGWTLEQVNAVLLANTPKPDAPKQYNQLAQTGNSGLPIQFENTQYNVNVRSIESKVGLFIKIAGASLWSTAIFVSSFFATLIQRFGNDGHDDLGASAILTLSLAVVTIPIFVVAYRKFIAAQRANPVSIDDIFFKRSVRRNLWWSVLAAAITGIVGIYQILSTLFLKNTSTSYATAFSFLVFTLGFAGIVAFYWRLHAKTQR